MKAIYRKGATLDSMVTEEIREMNRIKKLESSSRYSYAGYELEIKIRKIVGEKVK